MRLGFGWLGNPEDLARILAKAVEHGECNAPSVCTVPQGNTWCRTCGAQNYTNTMVQMIQDFGGDGFVDEIECIEMGLREYHRYRREMYSSHSSGTASHFLSSHWPPGPVVPTKAEFGGTILGIRISVVKREGLRIVPKDH